MLKLSNLCHCVQHSWKVTSRDFWSSRNESKPLSKQKCVLRKYCVVSQKWLMLELSNLCHCVQHSWKVTSKDFWISRNERKTLSKQKCVLRKCCGVSQKNSECYSFQTCAIVFSTPEKLLVRISGSLGMKESYFLSKNVFWENAVGYLKKQWMLKLSNLCHCVQHPWKVTSRHFWSSRNERKLLSKQKCVLRKCCGVSKKTVNDRAFKPVPLCSALLKSY